MSVQCKISQNEEYCSKNTGYDVIQTIKELAMTKTLLLEGLQEAIQGALWRRCSVKKAALENSKAAELPAKAIGQMLEQ